MALGDKLRVRWTAFTAEFKARTIHWQLRQTPMGEQWRLQWQRRKHPAYLKNRRVHPAYYRTYFYDGTNASFRGRVFKDCYGQLFSKKWRSKKNRRK